MPSYHETPGRQPPPRPMSSLQPAREGQTQLAVQQPKPGTSWVSRPRGGKRPSRRRNSGHKQKSQWFCQRNFEQHLAVHGLPSCSENYMCTEGVWPPQLARVGLETERKNTLRGTDKGDLCVQGPPICFRRTTKAHPFEGKAEAMFTQWHLRGIL